MADENEVALKIIFNDLSGNRLEVHRMDFHYVLDFVIGNSWGVMGLGNLKVSYTLAF